MAKAGRTYGIFLPWASKHDESRNRYIVLVKLVMSFRAGGRTLTIILLRKL